MDIKELIESGNLELYVMGSLSAEEAGEIDALRLTHPELNEEIQRIESAIISYADTHAIKPKEELKEKIAGRLKFAINLNLDDERIDSILIQMPGIYRVAAAAAIALIAVLGATTIYFANKYNSEHHQLLTLQSANTQLAGQLNVVNSQTNAIQGELAIANNPGNIKVVLKGLPISPSSNAVVYWDRETGSTYINSAMLPPPDANRQYQLWAMVDGKPVSLGVIAKNSAFNHMNEVHNPTAFCVTLEPLGGSAQPTLEMLYVKAAV